MVNRPVQSLLPATKSQSKVADLLALNHRLETARKTTPHSRNNCEALRNVQRPENVHSPIDDHIPP